MDALTIGVLSLGYRVRGALLLIAHRHPETGSAHSFTLELRNISANSVPESAILVHDCEFR